MNAQKIELWATAVEDKPGAVAEKLKALAGAKMNLEMVFARREPDKPGQGVLYIGPIKGKKAAAAAEGAGFKKPEGIVFVRIEGNDKPGMGAAITGALAQQGINLRELNATVIGKKFVCLAVFDSPDDAAKALRALKKVK